MYNSKMSQTILWLLEGAGDFLFTKPSVFFLFSNFSIFLFALRFSTSIVQFSPSYMSLIFTYV